MKIRDLKKIPLQHFAITRQPNPFAVVVHLAVNELLQPSPILPIQAVDVLTIDDGKTAIAHICLRGDTSFCQSRRSARRSSMPISLLAAPCNQRLNCARKWSFQGPPGSISLLSFQGGESGNEAIYSNDCRRLH